ncbi:MAG TPA: DoxX family protein [Tepidisphaeraceae bacterium]|jgi:uncharacterized membrane protein YphA (DoxX/SURF4 family)
MSTTTTPSKAPAKSSNLVGFYDHFARFADKWQSPFLLGIRLYIGYQCVISGYAHITHFHETVQTFIGWHIPMPEINVAMSALTEMIAGGLLLIGLFGRLAGLILVGNFIVAIAAPSLADEKFRPIILHFWEHPDVVVYDTAFPFLMTAIIILIFGPGFLSIDGIIKTVRGKK